MRRLSANRCEAKLNRSVIPCTLIAPVATSSPLMRITSTSPSLVMAAPLTYCAVVRCWKFAGCRSESKMMSASPGPCAYTALRVSNSWSSGGTSNECVKPDGQAHFDSCEL